VPLALYAARSVERFPFDILIRNVIEAGGDTDTIASMTGQVAGAWLSASGISQNLIGSIPNADEIERIVNEFAATL
jgi:ADP-ribosylglycohydrolase